ncbi:MAG: type II secretion system F family protein [Caldilineaceae bacterium]|nr:type II secretion system F family protein [Caldilineaceae bacterium]MBP8107369.1 type II secretion system F family protein [Caldilineaceae bacterium]MBP8124280.1 type II secretion system F family protein [Caldilineaceae bacterium]MBP9074272.1 type II secretion system F family protein [Caldilineaceae bacterium]
MEYLIAGMTTTALLLLIFGARQLLVQNVAVGERLPAGFGDREQGASSASMQNQVNARLEKGKYGKGLGLALVRADVKLRVTEFLSMCVALMAVMALIGTIATGNTIFGLLLGFASLLLPRIWLRRRQDQRLVRFQDQLPDVLSLLVSSLRSGYGMNQALKLVTQEMPSPSKEEYGRVAQELAYGYSLRESLDRLVERTGSQDLELVVTAIKVQHEVGGNLGEILDTIAETVRERVRIIGEIKVMTSSQMMTGYLLGGMPIAVGLFISLINPGYMTPVFSFPWMIIPIGALISIGLGLLVMRKMIKTDF